jgi:undecaprenyl-diphosphatase
VSILEALVLGLVQGLTEFIPISSSGHLVIVPALLGWDQPSLAFDVFLHGGSLIAVVIYFRRELLQLAKGIGRPGSERKLIFLLALGTVPAGIVGLLFEEQVSRLFEDPKSAALQLVGTGAVLIVSELVIRKRRSPNDRSSSTIDSLAGSLNPMKTLVVGAGQAASIVPGLSRSGFTIGAGLLVGMERAQAARFSFLLSIPVLAGATLVQTPDLGASHVEAGAILVGGVASLASSYFAVAGMIGYLQRRGLLPFAIYCFIAGPLFALFLR